MTVLRRPVRSRGNSRGVTAPSGGTSAPRPTPRGPAGRLRAVAGWVWVADDDRYGCAVGGLRPERDVVGPGADQPRVARAAERRGDGADVAARHGVPGDGGLPGRRVPAVHRIPGRGGTAPPRPRRAGARRRLALAGREHGDAVETAVESAIAAARALPPYPEAEAALDVLAEAGLRIATVTNSPTETAERSLDAAGLRDRFEHVVGSETCRAYKPSLEVYRNGLRRIGTEPGDAVMIASHAWDLLGASRAGMRTAWVSRGEVVRLETMPTPDATGADLLETARSIVDVLADGGGVKGR
ncbi:MAG: HAD-IA family hydrolase [Streptosporangiales bacterium]|nr:HAD-IA family hydrolase [Streptosporangiales bacterium]